MIRKIRVKVPSDFFDIVAFDKDGFTVKTAAPYNGNFTYIAFKTKKEKSETKKKRRK